MDSYVKIIALDAKRASFKAARARAPPYATVVSTPRHWILQ